MNETFALIFSFSMPAFVIFSMITMGLGLSATQIIEPFKNVKMVILALIANFVAVPLFVFAIITLIPLDEGVRIGLILLSLCGGAPFIPMIVSMAKSQVGSAVGLMLLLVIATIFLMPLAIPFLFTGASVSSWGIAQSLIFTVLIPLLIGLLIKAYFSTLAAHLQKFTTLLTNLLVLTLVIAMLVLYSEIIINNVMVLPIIFLFFLGSMGVGYLAGGKNRNARITLSVGTSLRNPPIAMLVASSNFSDKPMAAIVPLLVIVIGLSILFPLAKRIGNKTQAV